MRASRSAESLHKAWCEALEFWRNYPPSKEEQVKLRTQPRLFVQKKKK